MYNILLAKTQSWSTLIAIVLCLEKTPHHCLLCQARNGRNFRTTLRTSLGISSGEFVAWKMSSRNLQTTNSIRRTLEERRGKRVNLDGKRNWTHMTKLLTCNSHQILKVCGQKRQWTKIEINGTDYRRLSFAFL